MDAWLSEHANEVGRRLHCAAIAVRGGMQGHLRQRLPELERLYLDEVMAAHDAEESVQAFVEKRAPEWRDR